MRPTAQRLLACGILLCSASGTEARPVFRTAFCDPAITVASQQAPEPDTNSEIKAELQGIRLELAEQNLLLKQLLNPPKASKKKRILRVALALVDHTGSVASIFSELGVVK